MFAKKKPKTFSTVFGFVRPRPPKAQSWQAQQQTALQDVAFFSQLVALMSAAASTLNLGGRGANSSISKMVVAFILQTPVSSILLPPPHANTSGTMPPNRNGDVNF